MALKNFTQFTPQTVLSGTDNFVGYRVLDEIRSDLSSVTDAISGLLLSKGFVPGSSEGVVRKVSFRYTLTSGSSLNAVSGADDYGLVLSYTPTQVEVYRNGAYLAESLDFVANNGTQITNLSTMNVGDIVEVVALSSTRLTLASGFGTGDVSKINYRYSVATGNTIEPGDTLITGNDDFGFGLSFVSPNLDVYLNGSHLVRDMDYGSYGSGNSLILNDAVADGDTVEVVSLSANNLTQVVGITAYKGIQQIQAGKDFFISNITGTGIVTLSAKPGIRDIKVPDWTTGAHITNFSTLQQYLSAVAQSNRFTQPSAVYMEIFATNAYPVEAGTQNWEGGVLHPNGKIYCFPENASVILIIDPDSNTTTTTGAGSFGTVGNKYQGSILAPNGKIYGVPCGSGTTSRPQTVFQLLDPSNNTITAYASIASLPPTNAFQGGVCAPNGKLYLTPSTSSIFYFIDPSNNTVSAFATYVTNSSIFGQNYSFGCVGPNGKIYISPTGATVGRIIDPDTNTITTFGITGQSLPNLGAGIVAPNGKIYFVPNHSIGYILDPFNNNTISTYSCAPVITGATSSFGGRLAPNGKIYFASWAGTFFGMLDPDNNTVTQLGTVASVGYLGMVLTPKGKLVLIPAAATSITAYNLNLNNNFNINVCTNPMFNKI